MLAFTVFGLLQYLFLFVWLGLFCLKKPYIQGLLKVVGPQTPELYKYCHLGALTSGLHTEYLGKSRHEPAALPRDPLPRRPKDPENRTCQIISIFRHVEFVSF